MPGRACVQARSRFCILLGLFTFAQHAVGQLQPNGLSRPTNVSRMNTLESERVVRLRPNRPSILTDYNGKLVELIQTQPNLFLPPTPPAPDSEGNPWVVDIRNLGPAPVVIIGSSGFRIPLAVNQTIRIQANGLTYSARH